MIYACMTLKLVKDERMCSKEKQHNRCYYQLKRSNWIVSILRKDRNIHQKEKGKKGTQNMCPQNEHSLSTIQLTL